MDVLAHYGRVIYLGGLALLVLGLILAVAGSGLVGVLVGLVGFAALVGGLFGDERAGGTAPPRRPRA